MTVLETVADRQAKWSATANALKGTIDQARRSVLCCRSWAPWPQRSQEPWSDFVNDCEGILATENTSWIAKWTKMNQVAK